MATVNAKSKTISAKLVYYGPGLCGKTTNLQYVNQKLMPGNELMSLATEGDRTIFFDFMPLELGTIRGMNVKFKLYTVPGQVRYNQTRKMVLKNVDGVVFVADSQKDMLDPNLESFDNLFSNMHELNIDPKRIPIVLQYNKQDLPNTMSPQELDGQLNRESYPTFTASAVKGDGVVETLKAACREVLRELAHQFEDQARPATQAAAPASRAAAAQSAGGGGLSSSSEAARAPAKTTKRLAATERGKPNAVATQTKTAKTGPKGAPAHDQGQNGSSAATSEELTSFIARRMDELEGHIKTHGASKAFGSKLDEVSRSVSTLLQRGEDVSAEGIQGAVSEALSKGLPPKTELESLRPTLKSIADRQGVSPTKADIEELREAIRQLPTKADLEEVQNAFRQLPTKTELKLAFSEVVDGGLSDVNDAIAKLPSEKDLRALVGEGKGEGGSGVEAFGEAQRKELIDEVQETTRASVDAKLESFSKSVPSKTDLNEAMKKLAKVVEARNRSGAETAPEELSRSIDSLLEKKLDKLQEQLKRDAEQQAQRAAERAAEAVQQSTGELLGRFANDLEELRTRLNEALLALRQGGAATAAAATDGAVAAAHAEGARSDEAGGRLDDAGTTQGEAEASTDAGEEGVQQGEADAGDEDVQQGEADASAPAAGTDEPAQDHADDADDAETDGAQGDAVGIEGAADEAANPGSVGEGDGGSEPAAAGGDDSTSEDATDTGVGEEDGGRTETPDGEPSDGPRSAAAAGEGGGQDTDESSPDAGDGEEAGTGADSTTEAAGLGNSEDAAESAGADEQASRDDDQGLDDRPEHKNAARVARVLVADLYLYHRDEVEAGLREGDFFERNQEALEDMRTTYESRVSEEVRAEKDHFQQALERFMAKKRRQLGLEQ